MLEVRKWVKFDFHNANISKVNFNLLMTAVVKLIFVCICSLYYNNIIWRFGADMKMASGGGVEYLVATIY